VARSWFMDGAFRDFETPEQLFALKSGKFIQKAWQIHFKDSVAKLPVLRRRSYRDRSDIIDDERGLSYGSIRDLLCRVSNLCGYEKLPQFYAFRRNMASVLQTSEITPDLRDRIMAHSTPIHLRYYSSLLTVDSHALACAHAERPEKLDQIR
jgi:hypothetical protein